VSFIRGGIVVVVNVEIVGRLVVNATVETVTRIVVAGNAVLMVNV
jgi:hypothetical protein